MLLLCGRMYTNVFVYNPHIAVCVCMYSYVTRVYSYVLVWCFNRDLAKHKDFFGDSCVNFTAKVTVVHFM